MRFSSLSCFKYPKGGMSAELAEFRRRLQAVAMNETIKRIRKMIDEVDREITDTSNKSWRHFLTYRL